ncbi:hypothetical protein SCHPADRAFT_896197 [Schizopora paradoxa]|uniref:C2H2-type domain-containing protein n=1 Tax=Schizopora paradoxa TaxID=27342 RepID=A0A0H2R157_9AGAM|nr:hypothetical protein SCHPADRAFT_896197 [Schizopora paradoxa]
MPARRSSTTRSRVQCDECKKTFRGPFELNRHAVLHSNDKSRYAHKCPFPGCPHATLQKSNLKIHINSVHLKVQTYKCTVDPDVCQADFSDASSLIRHEKAIHRFYRKEDEFRPVETVVWKTRTKRSTDDEIAEPLTQEQLTAMLSSGSLLAMAPSPSFSSSSSSDSSSSYPSPSPSPDLPSPDALQSEYPQYFSYPDVSFAPMPVADQLSLDPAIYSTQSPHFYNNASYYGLSAPEFVQGCSSSSLYPAMAPSTQETYFGSYLSEPSFELLPPPPPEQVAVLFASSEAKDEWSSFLSAPVRAEDPSYSASEFATLNPIPKDLLDLGSNATFSSGSGFANISTEFDTFMEEFGISQRL